MESESDEKATGEPGSEAIVCGAGSRLTHVTVVPVFTISVEGPNAKSLILMVDAPPEATWVVTVTGVVAAGTGVVGA